MNLSQHKTKILGVITVALGFLQAYPGLPDLLPDTAYAWTMMVVGLGVTVCGYLNSQIGDDNGSQNSGV